MIPFNFFNKSLTTIEVLSELTKLNLSEYPDKKTHELISQLGKHSCMVTTIAVGVPIIRARVNCNFEEFSKKAEVSYKPSEYNTTYQRASTPNSTMFYGSINPDGTKFEKNDYRRLIGLCEICRLFRDNSLKEGEQRITYSKWVTTKLIPLVPIIYNFDNIPKGEFATNLQNDLIRFQSQFHKDTVERGNLVSKFLEEQFSKEETSNDFDYMLSAIYTERITHNLQHKLAGVLYPSVRTKEHRGKGFNVAINPEFVDNSMELEFVTECTAYKKGDRLFVDNDKEAIVAKGQEGFTLVPITNPNEHLGRDKVYKILNGEVY